MARGSLEAELGINLNSSRWNVVPSGVLASSATEVEGNNVNTNIASVNNMSYNDFNKLKRHSTRLCSCVDSECIYDRVNGSDSSD